ncbi:MAG: hypothetical protein PGN21_17040 [Sphingomonas paucimobilis]
MFEPFAFAQSPSRFCNKTRPRGLELLLQVLRYRGQRHYRCRSNEQDGSGALQDHIAHHAISRVNAG